MGKVVYLLGAGASYGARGEKDKVFKFKNPITGTIGQYSCPNIIAGLPIVSELPQRIRYMLSIIQDYMDKTELDGEKRTRCQNLADGFSKLLDGCTKHATIDTFVKKLWIQKSPEYKAVERYISAYFMLEQILIAKPDQRYDTFIASILDDLNQLFPDNISVISWNYDYQLELAFSEYMHKKSLSGLQFFLQSTSKNQINDSFIGSKFNIVKLNGSALFTNNNILIDPIDFQEDKIDYICNIVANAHINVKNLLSFSWERLKDSFEQQIISSVSSAETVVVIGYSFPFFNRKVDPFIFGNMKSLKKIYVQDMHPNNIAESIRNLLTDEQKKHITIEPRMNLDQFYLPPEL